MKNFNRDHIYIYISYKNSDMSLIYIVDMFLSAFQKACIYLRTP